MRGGDYKKAEVIIEKANLLDEHRESIRLTVFAYGNGHDSIAARAAEWNEGTKAYIADLLEIKHIKFVTDSGICIDD